MGFLYPTSISWSVSLSPLLFRHCRITEKWCVHLPIDDQAKPCLLVRSILMAQSGSREGEALECNTPVSFISSADLQWVAQVSSCHGPCGGRGPSSLVQVWGRPMTEGTIRPTPWNLRLSKTLLLHVYMTCISTLFKQENINSWSVFNGTLFQTRWALVNQELYYVPKPGFSVWVVLVPSSATS